MAYGNGLIPLHELVHLGGEHYLPPGTAARWKWLQRTAWEKYGVWLIITVGWNAYRPLSIQVIYKRDLGIMAAEPGKSSHGGTYRGQVVFAIDVNNWAALGWDRFSALCRLAGFTVNFVTPTELWHIGDFNNGWVIPAGAATTPVIKPQTTRQRRRRNMIHAAWRNVDGTIAVQCRPGGRITPLASVDDWAGISAGSGAGVAQISNEAMTALCNQYGTVKYPQFDTGSRRDDVSIVAPVEGGSSRYLTFGDAIWPVTNTGMLASLEAQGFAVIALPQDVIDARLHDTP